jgi:hypothetical protein
MELEIFMVSIWAIAGISTLCMNEVPKVSYAVCWGTLMMWLIKYLVEVIA